MFADSSDTSENQRTGISALEFYVCVCVCFKIRANLVIRATTIHAFYQCAIAPNFVIVCAATQICVDKLT